MPRANVVERMVAGQEHPLRSIAFVVQDDHHRAKAVADNRRQFHAGHLERTVAYQGDDPLLRPRHRHAQRGRHPRRRQPQFLGEFPPVERPTQVKAAGVITREVADAVVFLASDASSYITAQTINVNGGLYF